MVKLMKPELLVEKPETYPRVTEPLQPDLEKLLKKQPEQPS